MLNNVTKAQFMDRVGSYSTRGSQRGYSDLGEPIDARDHLSFTEQREVIIRRIDSLRGLPKRTSLQKSEMNNLQSEMAILKQKIKQDNITSSAKREESQTRAMCFMRKARDVLTNDQYMEIVNLMKKEFEE